MNGPVTGNPSPAGPPSSPPEGGMRGGRSSGLPVTGYRLRVTGYGLPVTGYRLRVTGYRLLVTELAAGDLGVERPVRGAVLQRGLPGGRRARPVALPRQRHPPVEEHRGVPRPRPQDLVEPAQRVVPPLELDR